MIDHRETRPVALSASQQAIVDAILASQPPRRFVISGAAGMGKSTAVIAALVALAEVEETRRGRSLLICPSALRVQYAERLARFSLSVRVVDPPTYRRMQTDVGEGGNPWVGTGYYVVSPKFFAKGHRLAELLTTEWDEVFFDGDSHLSNATQWSDILRVFWASSKVTTVLAALRSPALASYGLREPVTQLLQLNAEFSPALPARRLHRVAVKISDAEEELGRNIKDAAERLTALSPEHAVFVHSLLRAWDSSLYAVEQVLRRAILGAQNEWWTTGEDVENELSTSAFLQAYRHVRIGAEAVELLTKVEQITEDSKWKTCEALIASAGTDAMKGPILFFTESEDTALYLNELLKEHGYSTLVFGTDSTLTDDHVATRNRFGGKLAVIAITQSTIGQEFEASYVIHYDLPQEPLLYWVRMTRVHPAHTGVIDHFFLTRDSSAGVSLDELERESAKMGAANNG
jgi:hypothetical protein